MPVALHIAVALLLLLVGAAVFRLVCRHYLEHGKLTRGIADLRCCAWRVRLPATYARPGGQCLEAVGPIRLDSESPTCGDRTRPVGSSFRMTLVVHAHMPVGLPAHWMVRAEEGHLHQEFGEEYERYCPKTPRYIGIPWRESR
jgi:hypothetical protein